MAMESISTVMAMCMKVNGNLIRNKVTVYSKINKKVKNIKESGLVGISRDKEYTSGKMVINMKVDF